MKHINSFWFWIKPFRGIAVMFVLPIIMAAIYEILKLNSLGATTLLLLSFIFFLIFGFRLLISDIGYTRRIVATELGMKNYNRALDDIQNKIVHQSSAPTSQQLIVWGPTSCQIQRSLHDYVQVESAKLPVKYGKYNHKTKEALKNEIVDLLNNAQQLEISDNLNSISFNKRAPFKIESLIAVTIETDKKILVGNSYSTGSYRGSLGLSPNILSRGYRGSYNVISNHKTTHDAATVQTYYTVIVSTNDFFRPSISLHVGENKHVAYEVYSIIFGLINSNDTRKKEANISIESH